MRYSPEELQQATDCLMKELGVDNARARSFGFHLLWAVSILRVFIKDMSALDDAGITHMSYLDGSTYPIDGYDISRQEKSYWAKWTQRSGGWVYMHRADIDHVTDWLWAAASGVHHWLSDLDEKGRPKKLMKCGSIQALAAEADKMGRKRNAEGGLRWKPLTSDEVQLIADLGGGLYLHRLLSARALDQESRHMDHCVGDGDYDNVVRDPNHLILSIRDVGGNPLATVEVVNGVVEQIVGPGNMSAARYVVSAFEAYRDSVGWRDGYEVWHAQRVRAMAFIALRYRLGWPYSATEYEQWLESPEADQEADIIIMRAAADLLPDPIGLSPEDEGGYHIIIDENGQPTKVPVDPEAFDPLRPR